MPNIFRSESGPKTVEVSLTQGQLDAIENLVETGAFSNKSQAVHWLVTQGLRTIPVGKLSPMIREMMDAKATAKKIKEMRRTGNKDAQRGFQIYKQRWIQAWGSRWGPKPAKEPKNDREWFIFTHTSRGFLSGDDEVPIGIDRERRVLVSNRGKTEIPLNKDHYSEAEKDLIRKIIPDLERREEQHRLNRQREEDLFEGLLREAREALKR